MPGKGIGRAIDEIEAVVTRNRISIDDIQIDLDTRDNYPGEFYVLPLMVYSAEQLREYLAWRARMPGNE